MSRQFTAYEPPSDAQPARRKAGAIQSHARVESAKRRAIFRHCLTTAWVLSMISSADLPLRRKNGATERTRSRSSALSVSLMFSVRPNEPGIGFTKMARCIQNTGDHYGASLVLQLWQERTVVWPPRGRREGSGVVGALREGLTSPRRLPCRHTDCMHVTCPRACERWAASMISSVTTASLGSTGGTPPESNAATSKR